MFEWQPSRKLSLLDEILPFFYFAYLLCFAVATGGKNRIRFFLQSSLTGLLAERPYLTCNIRHIKSGKARPVHLILDIPESLEDTKIVFNDLAHAASGWKDTYQQVQAARMPANKLELRVLAPWCKLTL